jgi:hypothetical protein
MAHDESMELTSFAINLTRKSSNIFLFHTVPACVLTLFEIKERTVDNLDQETGCTESGFPGFPQFL